MTRFVQRPGLWSSSAFLCVTAVVGLPFAARSLSERTEPPPGAHLDVPSVPLAVAATTPRLVRDPFAGPHSSPAAAVDPRQTPAADPSARVLGLVAGNDAAALVDDGSGARVVKVGDRVAGSPIVAIGLSGVVLGNGRTLTVPQP